eukprot:3940340-Rhodomonas_salina.4
MSGTGFCSHPTYMYRSALCGVRHYGNGPEARETRTPQRSLKRSSPLSSLAFAVRCPVLNTGLFGYELCECYAVSGTALSARVRL